MVILLPGVILIAVGLILKYCALARVQNQGQMATIPYFSGCLSNLLVMSVLVGFLVTMFGYTVVVRTYYDFLSLGLLWSVLFAIYLLALFGLGLVAVVVPNSFVNIEGRMQRIFFLTLGVPFFLFILVLCIYFILPSSIETFSGLVSGPQAASGVVERKSTSVSRGGTSYYIDINGHHARIPDSAWWHSLQKGDEMDYLYNPYATDVFDIFQPDQIRFTVPGLIFVGIILILWLFTLLLAWEGISDGIAGVYKSFS